MKYLKKPIVIDAWQWPDEYKEKEIGAKIQKIIAIGDYEEDTCKICGMFMWKHANCPTMSGLHSVCPGDYIVKEITEGFYPCRKDIFELTYIYLNEE